MKDISFNISLEIEISGRVSCQSVDSPTNLINHLGKISANFPIEWPVKEILSYDMTQLCSPNIYRTSILAINFRMGILCRVVAIVSTYDPITFICVLATIQNTFQTIWFLAIKNALYFRNSKLWHHNLFHRVLVSIRYRWTLFFLSIFCSLVYNLYSDLLDFPQNNVGLSIDESVTANLFSSFN